MLRGAVSAAVLWFVASGRSVLQCSGAALAEPSAAAFAAVRTERGGALVSEFTLTKEAHVLSSEPRGECVARGHDDKALMPGQDSSEHRLPTIALLFLLSSTGVHERVWRAWLDAAPSYAAFAIYAHLNKHTCPQVLHVDARMGEGGDSSDDCTVAADSILADALIEPRVAHDRISLGIVTAERLLLRAALRDGRCSRFVLLSEGSVPIWPARFVAEALLAQPAMVGAWFDTLAHSSERERNKYHHSTQFFREQIPPDAYAKSSQWVALTRTEACEAVNDGTVARAFAVNCAMLKCNPTPGVDNFTKPEMIGRLRMAPDELYFATLIRSRGMHQRTVCHGTHFAQVEMSHGGHALALAGSHSLTAARIMHIRQQATCELDTGMHQEGMTHLPPPASAPFFEFNHSVPVCALFARKVPLSEQDAYMRWQHVWNTIEEANRAVPGMRACLRPN